MGTINILEAVGYNKIGKIIYAASSSCYGIPKNFLIYENSTIDTISLCFFQNTLRTSNNTLANVYKIKYVSLRLFNVYGTRSRTD